MVNKLITSITLGSIFVVTTIINNWVLEKSGHGESALLYMLIFSFAILSLNPPEQEELLGSIIESQKKMAPYLPWFVFADLLWILWYQLFGAGLDLNQIVWHCVLVAITLVNGALMYGGVRAFAKTISRRADSDPSLSSLRENE